MKDFYDFIDSLCKHRISPPAGFGDEQCNTLVEVSNALATDTRAVIQDRQVYGFIKKHFRLPTKKKGEKCFVIWRDDIVRVINVNRKAAKATLL